jgi:hypothetical protein
MKNRIVFFIPYCLFFFCSCKKNSTAPGIPPGNPNNEVKATISINGSIASSYTANGNSTLFIRRIDNNVDTVIVIHGGGIGKGQVQITLVNINLAGTYVFETDPGSKQDSFCDYSIGNPVTGPYELYSTQASNPTGIVTIESVTSTHIKGSFTANCGNGVVQLTNGSFKGDFEP